MLRKMLQGFGLTVDTVDSAEEALNYLRGQRPDAIFMDHTMPGLDGIAAVRQIKREPGTAQIPVTMYTSKDDQAYQDEARAAGAIGVLVKPATPDALGIILKQMNELFDAAMAAGIPAPAPAVTVPAAVGERVSTEQIERIALEKAEAVVYNAIESQVLPLINDVIAKVRRDLEAGQETVSARVASRECEAQLAKWQPPSSSPDSADLNAIVAEALRAQLPPLLQERVEALQREGRTAVERQINETASRIWQSESPELTERLSRKLTASATEAAEKVKESIQEAVIQTSRDVALKAISEAESANAASNLVAEHIFQQLLAEAKRDLQRRIYQAATWAAAIGIGAAVLAYALR
ncbi:MAG: response regulator [Candidatus Competibacteraceae bacterium]|nr:response regulator [Candidatus Competibacteraceae bacterium]